MNDDSPQILDLAGAVSDDQPLDWARAEESARDPRTQSVIRQLALIAKLSQVCRTPERESAGAVAQAPALDGSTTVEGGLGTWAHLRLLELVGSGAFGNVYRAWDNRLGREVALKILAPSLASPDQAGAFVREGGLLARVRHPNVVAVFGAETLGGKVGIWMEFVRGRTLAQIVKEDGVLGAEEAALIGVTLCRAVAAVHNAGLLHRDIKPQNVIRETGGRIVLMDFGLGRDMAAVAPAWSVLNMAGTPLYLAPEVLRGGAPSLASDIYSIGVLLYFLVTGTYPVQGRNLDELRVAHDQGTPRLLHDVRANLLPPFVATVEGALASDADRRFKTCGAMQAALASVIGAKGDSHDPAEVNLQEGSALKPEREGARAGRSESARDLRPYGEVGVGAGRRVSTRVGRTWPARRRLVATLTAATFIGVGALLAAFVVGRWSARPGVPEFKQLTFRHGMVLSARFAPDGHTIVYSAGWEGKPIELYSVRTESPESRALDLPSADILSISSAGEMAISLGRRYLIGFAARGTLARVPLGGGAPREVLTDVDDADWAPDGEALAVAHVVAGEYRLEYPIGTVLYRTDGWISHLRVSPDGRHVAFMDHRFLGDDRGTVSLVGTDGQKRVLTHTWASANGLAWSPDGKEIWFTAAEAGPNCALYATDLSGRIRLITRSVGRFVIEDLYSDGRVLLTEGRFRIGMAYRAGGLNRELSWLDVSIANDFSADGKEVLFIEEGTGEGTGAGAVYRRGTDGTPAVRLGKGSIAALSPDGNSVAAVVSGRPPSLTVLTVGAGSPRSLTTAELAEYQALAWLPDGRHLVIAAREAGRAIRLYVQDVEGGPPRPVSADGVGILTYSNPVSPDGRHVAAVDAEGRVGLQPMNGGAFKPLPTLAAGDTPIRWNRDGTALYIYRRHELPARVYRLDLDRGRRELVTEIAPADPAGLRGIPALLTSPDGDRYVYSYSQMLSSLYLAAGLR